MAGWTREQAIADVILAADGFGRAYGPDLEVRDQLSDLQPCVAELARHILHLRFRGVWERLTSNAPVKRCARPGCPGPVLGKKKLYCGSRCAIAESRRRHAARKRKEKRKGR